MKVLSGGIDIGSEKHHIVVMDAGEAILYDQEVEHNISVGGGIGVKSLLLTNKI